VQSMRRVLRLALLKPAPEAGAATAMGRGRLLARLPRSRAQRGGADSLLCAAAEEAVGNYPCVDPGDGGAYCRLLARIKAYAR